MESTLSTNQQPYFNLYPPKKNTNMFKERSNFTSLYSDTEGIIEI